MTININKHLPPPREADKSLFSHLSSLIIKYGMKMPKSVRYFGIRLLALCQYPPVLVNYFLHNNDKFRYELAIAAIMKNEGPYLREWIEYHKLVGAEKFYLYDNESTDNTKEVLAPYIQDGTVEYIYFQGRGVKNQIRVYRDAAKRFRNEVKWLAVIDIDEFIVPVSRDKIIDVVNDLQNKLWKNGRKKLFGLAARWVRYGYGGHYSKPEGLVIENFRKNEGASVWTKSIINPRAAFFTAPLSVHMPVFLDLGFGRTETGEESPWEAPISADTIRVNHYITKSYEEYAEKVSRNKTGFPETVNLLPEYDSGYLSLYEDDIMDKYVDLLKSRLEEIKK